MRYGKVVQGRFLSRPNRFIALVEINGAETVCHVKNTGRCRELLRPGAAVYLERSENPARRTAFDLIAVDKGVTLEENGHARFPDAPTERGVKHLHELMRAVTEGHRATVFFVLQMAGMTDFAPNDDTHPAFGAALRQAAEAGVHVAAYGCRVTPDTLELDRPVPVIL